MNLSAAFIRRPVGTILLTIGLALAGIGAFFRLPVAPLPQVDIPTIAVQANLPGASPQTMAATVAAPLEHRLGTIAGVTEMSSRSGVGSAQVVLQFDLSRDVDGAARDVQAAINAARADLPASLKTNPSYRKFNPADAPIEILTLTSSTRTPSEVYNEVSNIVQQRLLQVSGVGNVELGGAALPSVRVEVDPTAISRYGISLEDVRTSLQSASANRPRGVIDSYGDGVAGRPGGSAFQIYTNQAGLHAADYRDAVIAYRGGAVVRLSDVAQVVDGPEDVRTMGLFNGQRAVPIIITRQPGANIVATVDAINAQLPGLQASLPGDIKLSIANDRTRTIRASLVEVEVALLISTLLVVLVVSLFLRSWRATLIPAVAVIVSLLGTLGIMYMAGFSLDNLSLMALTVATGFVVDDAIVVVENIARHVEEGMNPFQAALRGAREVSFTVLSMSASLVAVFVPLIFMGGIVGRLFREFALTMSAAVAISLVVSLTTTPMLASRLLVIETREGRLMRWSRIGFDKLQARYTKSLDWALANRGPILLLFFGTIVLNVYLIAVAPKGFFPNQDTGGLQGGIRADQSISFPEQQAKLTQIVNVIRKDPAIATVVAFSGGGRAGGGFLFATLKPRGERPPVDEVIQRLRPKLSRISGISAFLNPVQDLQTGGRQTSSTYQYVLKADSAATLKDAADRLTTALKKQSDVMTDVDQDQQDAGADVFVEVDRDAAARLGVNMAAVDAALYDAFGQRQVANIYSGLNQYHVVMEAAPAFNGTPNALANIYVPSSKPAATAGRATSTTTSSTPAASIPGSTSGTAAASGGAAAGSAISTAPANMIPLSAISKWSTGSTNAQVNHTDAEPSTTISFNTPPGVSLGTASARIALVQSELNLPATVHGDFGGTAKVFQQSTSSMPLLVLSALLAIYIVLGILYESAIHPLTALSTLPSAGVGAVFALIVTGGQFDLIAFIGIILLIGIVKKNAILIIDFALDAERSRGLSAAEAIREAAILRFRPILMTTLAAALGALPLAIGFGDGAELRRPLGIAIIGGLIASQFLTLLTTPVIYLALDRFRRRGKNDAIYARHATSDIGDPDGTAGAIA
jgi:multidrug efflux pump